MLKFKLQPGQKGTVITSPLFQTFGIIMTMGMRAMIERVSVLGANITVSVVLLLGAIGTGKLLITGNNLYVDELISHISEFDS